MKNQKTNHSRSRSKSLHFAVALALLSSTTLGGYGVSMANPAGGVVSGGSATITESGSRLDIHQHTNRAVIDWRSFDIEAGEITQFYQPSSSSIALNRVNSADPSRIFGELIANGNVILSNPNGVLFGAGSKVDVNGLIFTVTGC